ncbi:MAG: LamG-like jellyroll fold domain-containing protein, partial [bacterium]|nr:LamG-like jellyroll fold domain-containing protein [bacterium]
SFTVTNTGGGTLTGTVSTASPFGIGSGDTSGLLNGLVAHWPLDEESGARSDAVGENTLTDENGVGSTGGIPSGTRSARLSRANSQSLSHTDSAGLSMGDVDFTIAFWVYLESKPRTEMYFVSKLNEPTDREYLVGYNDGPDRFTFAVSSDGTGAGSRTVRAGNLGSPSTGTWYFVVAWHDSVNDEIAIQVNDGPADTKSHTGGVYDGGTTFRLGARFNSPSAFLDGRMAEVGIWKRLLTDVEKTALYNSGNGFVYPFSGASSGGSFSLDAGASATVAVRFSPTAAQSYSGAVSFASNGGSASRTVTGTGQLVQDTSVSTTETGTSELAQDTSVSTTGTGTGQVAQGTSVSTTGTVDENSLAGRWRAYTVLSGGTVEGWLKGELSIDAGGSVTGGSLTDPAGTTYSIAEGSASIDSDGYLDLALMFTDGTFSITNASTNLTRDLIVGVGSQNGNPMWFVLVKESNQISQADMEGIWYLYTAESGGDQIEEALEGHSWGWLSVGESGGIIDGAEAASGGGVFSSATGQLSLNSNDGTFTGSHTYIEGTIRTIVAASLSPQKSFAVGVGHRADGATTKYFLFVATIKAGTFRQSDTAGSWNGSTIASNPAPLREECGYKTVELGSDGFITGGSDTNCDGNTANFTSGQMTLGPEGVVTAQISSTDGFSQSKQGSMTRTKNEMVLVTHNPSEESHSLVVLMR